MRMLLLLGMPLLLLAQSRPAVRLENGAARVTIDLGGGSLVGFELKSKPLNPLVWNDAKTGGDNRAMGHFLCLDRWGQVSEAEGRNGMPFHGEATKVLWKADSTSPKEARMNAALPIAQMDVERSARLDPSQALLVVRESVTNRNRLGRPYNMVQHPTIGPPFLDRTVMVDANARRGFMQSSPLPNPEEPSVFWPQALQDGQPVDLRHLDRDPMPNVVSYIVEDEWGWVTAVNPGQGLLIGYLWKTSEYPWLNIWRHVADGEPLARGLEFGTTGLHQPFQTLLRKGRIFGRPLFSWLEPGETHTRSYAMFLMPVPPEYRGVAEVAYRNGRLTVKERETNREMAMAVSNLF